MLVFLSWSGDFSHSVAKVFSEWLPQVINAVNPWISSEDIKKGSRWFEEIGTTLSDTNAGIIFVTSENLTAPWLYFEAGALSKSIDKSRVIPFLVDVSNSELVGPLTNFNTVSLNKNEILKLLQSLNESLGSVEKRDNEKLSEAFDVWWPILERKLKEIIANKPTDTVKTKKRSQSDILEEVLILVRALHRSPDNYQTNIITTIEELADEIGTPEERLIEQFKSAGFYFSSKEDPVTQEHKERLLNHLRTQHSPEEIKPVAQRPRLKRKRNGTRE